MRLSDDVQRRDDFAISYFSHDLSKRIFIAFGRFETYYGLYEKGWTIDWFGKKFIIRGDPLPIWRWKSIKGCPASEFWVWDGSRPSSGVDKVYSDPPLNGVQLIWWAKAEILRQLVNLEIKTVICKIEDIIVPCLFIYKF